MAGTTIVRPGTHERTIRWMKNEIQSLKNRLSQAGMGEIPGGAYEPALGSPLVDHYVLESTIAGVRAWVASGVGPDLTAIEALTGEGLAVRTAADTWALREIAVSGNGLNAVTNPKGIAGNPTLSLNIGTGANQVAAGDHAHAGVYEPVIAAGTTAQYWRGDKSWQTLNQAAVAGLKTDDSPVFVTVKLSGLTDGFIPYHASDASGLANTTLKYLSSVSLIFTDYTLVGRMYSGADAVFGHNVYCDSDSRVLKQLNTGWYGSWIRMYKNEGIKFGFTTAAGTAGDTVCDPAGTTNEAMALTSAGLSLSGLTASLPVVTDGSKNLASLDYATFKTNLAIAQADVAGLTTADGPTFDHLHITNDVAAASVSCSGNIDGGDASVYSGNKSVDITDDGVYSFTPSTEYGGLFCLHGTSEENSSGIVAFRASATLAYCTALALGSNVAVTTGALTGTTGTDGKITISSHTDGKIYIENRRGGTRHFSFMIIAAYVV